MPSDFTPLDGVIAGFYLAVTTAATLHLCWRLREPRDRRGRNTPRG